MKPRALLAVVPAPACTSCGDPRADYHLCESCWGSLADLDAERPRRLRALLTVGEAAAELRVTPATVRGYIAAGRLRAIDLARSPSRNGHRWRIARRALLALFDTPRD